MKNKGRGPMRLGLWFLSKSPKISKTARVAGTFGLLSALAILIATFQNCSKVEVNDFAGGVVDSNSTGTPLPGPSIGLPGGECKEGETRLCQTDHGFGEQKCGADSLFQGCLLSACKANFVMKEGQCLAQICQAGGQAECKLPNGMGVKVCGPDGLNFGDCTLQGCDEGYIASGGSCAPNPACVASFSVTSGQVSDVVPTLSSRLTYSAALGSTATYACTSNGVAGPTGSFSGGTTSSVDLSFGYPSSCVVTVTRTDNVVATCVASINVTCPSTIHQKLYDSTVQTFNPKQEAIANAGIDGSFPTLDSNLNFSPASAGTATRYSVTCASRWCTRAEATGDPAAVGVLKVPINYVNGSYPVDRNATTTVECRSNKTQTVTPLNNVCKVELDNRPPIENFQLDYSAPTPCGSNVYEVSGKWPQGLAVLEQCGTAYCTGLNRGFQWGVLLEVNNAGYLIKCSRAAK